MGCNRVYDWNNFNADCISYEKKLTTAAHKKTSEWKKVVEEYSHFLEGFKKEEIPLGKKPDYILSQMHINRLFAIVIAREYTDKLKGLAKKSL